MIECDNKLTAGEHVQSESDIKFWSNNILELECMQIMYKKLIAYLVVHTSAPINVLRKQ